MAVNKTHSRFITAQMREYALVNARRHSWVRDQRDRVLAVAEAWVNRSDDVLWSMVPGQELPRTLCTTEGVRSRGVEPGCPNCGRTGFDQYRMGWWFIDGKKPWTLTCRICSEIYPKNNFGEFYVTALDSTHVFRKELGDRSLLFNKDHPDPEDPHHRLYVDDGYGMTDADGNRHDIIAYYCHYGIWRPIEGGVNVLGEAFAFTGDRRYAHKAAVLLDRIADVYPEMDYLPLHKMGFHHSQGGTGEGRIEGCIWETSVARGLARCYDLIFDGIQGDEKLVGFCLEKSIRYGLAPKDSIDNICLHIQKDLLLEALSSVKDGRIRGNTGMTQCSLATLAIALDDPELTPKWLDWLFDPEYPGEYSKKKDAIPWVLTEGLDRDGVGGECGGYALIWLRQMQKLVQILSAYPEYHQDLVTRYPKLKQAFLAESRLNVLDAMMPNTGDSAIVGKWERRGTGSTYMHAYKIHGDKRFARLAKYEQEIHGSDLRRDLGTINVESAGAALEEAQSIIDGLKGLSEDVFEDDPDRLINEVTQEGDYGTRELRSEFFGRYGQAQLQSGTPRNGRATFIHYGFDKGHSHQDCLNLGLVAKNMDMIPDLGYPEMPGNWPKGVAFTKNTISHNTLMIGDRGSELSPGGQLEIFAEAAPLRVMQVDGSNAYEEADTYRRTVAMIDVGDSDSYVVDIFRACGGDNHRLSWHGASESAEVSGLRLDEQSTGTLAGPEVPYGKLDGEKGEFLGKSGFSYLHRVARSRGRVDHPYTVDWKIEDIWDRLSEGDEPHLRMHAFTDCDEVAMANGNAPRNVQLPRYLIQSRLGEDVNSQFVNVLEPYENKPFIREIRQLEVEHELRPEAVCAIEVSLLDGRKDFFVSCEQPTEVKVEGGLYFHGLTGLVRQDQNGVQQVRMVGGTRLTSGAVNLETEVGILRGTVTGVDVSDQENNLVYVDVQLPAGNSLIGRTIHFHNDLPLDTSYKIKGYGDGAVSTGDLTVVRGFKNFNDYDSGHAYLVNRGDEFTIPLVSTLR